VDGYADGEALAHGLTAEVKGGHCPGHAILHFAGAAADPALTMLGH
jgi:hypothetical protein